MSLHFHKFLWIPNVHGDFAKWPVRRSYFRNLVAFKNNNVKNTYPKKLHNIFFKETNFHHYCIVVLTLSNIEIFSHFPYTLSCHKELQFLPIFDTTFVSTPLWCLSKRLGRATVDTRGSDLFLKCPMCMQKTWLSRKIMLFEMST